MKIFMHEIQPFYDTNGTIFFRLTGGDKVIHDFEKKNQRPFVNMDKIWTLGHLQDSPYPS